MPLSKSMSRCLPFVSTLTTVVPTTRSSCAPPGLPRAATISLPTSSGRSTLEMRASVSPSGIARSRESHTGQQQSRANTRYDVDRSEERVVDLSFDVNGVEPFLRFMGSIAVLAGTALVIVQLRINAGQARSRKAFDLIGKVTDPSFPIRRHLLYEVAARHADGDWTGFDRSLDDFQVRSFANIYEQLGLLVRKRVIDLNDVMEALSAQPMADWATFGPVRQHIIDSAGILFPELTASADRVYWPNFAWLAAENSKWVARQ